MNLEKSWLDGEIGTKECLEGQLKNVRVTKSALHNFLKKVELDPHFHQLLSLLVREGIKPVILSDNFTCIIEKILENHGIKDLKVTATLCVFTVSILSRLSLMIILFVLLAPIAKRSI